ncbi:MAG: histidine triad nucleotide-binding protein [Magnetococcales bacterium]|nr:histidine triad nucleotide-binding protein [Magnetococcales bacterium]
MSTECLFCRIAAKEVPAQMVYEDDQVCAFKDISPQAPVHLLVIPKQHIESLNLLTEQDRDIMGVVMERVAHLARQFKIHESGYRTIINTNQDGGQVVFHLHVHILGGRAIGPMVARSS